MGNNTFYLKSKSEILQKLIVSADTITEIRRVIL
jgi:hypothetical protein